MSRSTLVEKVRDELEWETKLDASGISVSVKGNNVVLAGIVPSYSEKLTATVAARRVAGIGSVTNELEVHLPPEFQRPDDEIANSIATILEWSALDLSHRIKVSVRDAHVTLTGNLDWNYQKREIEKLIEPNRFVVGIANNITVQTRPVTADIEQKIRDALKRSAIIEADRIKVSITGDVAWLEGKVKSQHEIQLIEKAVWSAPGIHQIVDKIIVE